VLSEAKGFVIFGIIETPTFGGDLQPQQLINTGRCEAIFAIVGLQFFIGNSQNMGVAVGQRSYLLGLVLEQVFLLDETDLVC